MKLCPSVSERSERNDHRSRRLVFSVLISNTDDHLRNHGFVRNGGWRLAPAFHLNPDPSPGPTYLSTSIDRDEPATVAAALAVAAADDTDC